ncbi:MAG: DMT family transporter, partial [Acidimicrobiia bacterium]|nr:DMT family transporter [Acidimicrobiia bacterium]
MDRRPLLAAVASIVGYSIGPVLVQVSDASAPVFAFWRGWLTILATATGAATLRTVSSRRRERTPVSTRQGLFPLTVRWREWWTPVVAGVLNGASTLAFIQAVKLTSVAGTTLILLMNPVLIALWAIPLFGERPGIRFRLWTLVALIGAAVVVTGGSSGAGGDPLGMALAVVSVALLSTQMVVTKVGRRTLNTVPMHITTTVSGATFVTIVGLLAGHDFTDITRTDVLCVLGVVALPATTSSLLMTWALRWLPANVPPLIHLPIPFFAGTLAWVFLDEVMTLHHLLGGAVTLVGVAAALLSSSGRRLLAAGSVPGPPAGPAPS